MKTEPQDALSEQLLRRIWGEFSEMPGLRLTQAQARRLWGLDEETCTRILDLLVETKFLCRTGLHGYQRLTEGAVAFPGSRIGETEVDQGVIGNGDRHSRKGDRSVAVCTGSAATATDGRKYGDGW